MKNLFLTLFVLLFSTIPSYAGLYVAPQSLEQDASGFSCTGCLLYFYVEGTSTPKNTYTDKALTIAHANPVVADSAGRFDPIYLDGSYKVILKNADSTTIWTEDNFSTGASTDFFGDTTTVSITTAIDASYEKKNILASGTINLNLLASATAGDGFVFSVRNAGVGVITIDPNASETINSAATFTINPGESALIISDGTNWFTLFNDTVSLGATQTFTGANTFSGSTTFSGTAGFDGKMLISDDGERTLSSDIISLLGTYHTVDTEANAASDDLVTISSTANGEIALLRAENSARTVVVKHNTGNIFVPQALDVSLEETQRVMGVIYDSELSKYVVLFDGTTKEYVVATADSAAATAATTAKVQQGTSVASTSGTAINFTGIPAGVKKITITLSGVSTSGTNNVLFQIGDAGGIETSGYLGATSFIAVTTPQATNYTNGANLPAAAASVFHGTIELSLVDAATFTWAAAINVSTSDAARSYWGGYSKPLSAELTQLTITTVGASDTFDAGIINIQYEN